MEANVIIVGGGPAGVITALTAKSVYPEKSVCVIKEIGDGVIPCAIPYMIHTLSDTKQNAAGDMPLENAGIDIKVGKVVVLDAKARTVTLEAGEVLSYEKLVLATGTEVFAATSIYWPVKSKMPTATEKDRKRLKKKESWELWFLFRNTQR